MSMEKVIKQETECFRSHHNRGMCSPMVGNGDGIVKYCDK